MRINAGALLRGLQTLRKVIQTTLDRAFVRTAAALLTVLLTLLAALLTILLAIKGLFAFTNPLRDPIARQRIRGVFQLARGALLSLALSGAHRARRLLDVLLQTTHRISQRVFAFRQLLASLARVFILRPLPAASRETLHVFCDLTLSRGRLRRTLTQVGDLLLASGRARLSTALSSGAIHLLQTLLCLPQAFQRAFVLRDRVA